MSFGLYPLSGLFVGFLVGLTGVGGGSLMTPLLILVFGVHPGTAVGSDLLYASVTKMFGAGMHGQHGSVDWRITGRLACGSVPAVALTLAAVSIWPGLGESPHFIPVTLGIVLLCTSALLIFREAFARFLAALLGELTPRQVVALTVAMGVLLGCVVMLTSVGAGAIGVTALVVLYPRVPSLRLVGSDIAHAVPLTLLAGLGHWLLGDVDFGLVGPLLLGSVPGVIGGSLLSFRLPDFWLRVVLAIVLTVAAWRLLV